MIDAERISAAKKAGYSDDEILNSLSQKQKDLSPRLEAARKAGYSSEEILSRLQKPPPIKENATRATSQVAQGALEATPYGLSASGLQLLGLGESIAELDDLEDRYETLKKEFPFAKWPEKFPREKYIEGLQGAVDYFPTVSNIARVIEEKTGIPLQPQTELDKDIRFASSATAFKGGKITDSVLSGLKAGAMRSALKEAGVPEIAADALGLYYGLREKTAGPTNAFTDVNQSIEKAKNAQIPANSAPPLGNPPEGPSSGVGPIAPGTVVPKFESDFELRNDVVESLAKPPPGRPLTAAERAIKESAERYRQPQAAVEGRASPSGRDTGLRPTPPAAQDAIEDQIGSIFSRERFYNTRQGGEAVAREIQELDNQAYGRVNELYDRSRQLNRNVEDFHPELVERLQSRLNELEEIPSLSGPEIQLRTALRRILGRLRLENDGIVTGYLPISNQTLIGQVQSLRKKIDFDFAHGDANNIFKPTIRDLNSAIENAARNNPEALDSLVNAREAYREWAENFNNPYIRPLRDRSNRDYSKTYKSLQDLDEFNRVRTVLSASPRGRLLERGLARSIAEKKLAPHLRGNAADTRALDAELRELSSFATPEEIARVRQVIEAPRQRPLRQMDARQLSRAKQKPIPPEYKEPEDITSAFNSRSGIRRLRENLRKNGRQADFDKLAEGKIQSILRQNKTSSVKLTGNDIVKVLDATQNYEILSELMGKEAVDILFEESKKVAAKEFTEEKALEVGKKLAKHAVKAGILKTILTTIL